MAKTIKFNLICDGKQIRTMEDLRENFEISDLLTYYIDENRILHRWLQVRGYTAELEELEKITSTDPSVIVRELVRIFAVTMDEQEIASSICSIEYEQKRRALHAEFQRAEASFTENTTKYLNGYKACIDTILANKDDAIVIKASIAAMVKDYYPLFEMNHRELFYLFKRDAMLALMCLLMNPITRKFYLLQDDEDATLDKDNMYKDLKRLCGDVDNLSDLLGDNLKVSPTFSSDVVDYPQDLEVSGKQYMIITMDSYMNNEVQPFRDIRKKYKHADVHAKFIILDGITYRPTATTSNLYYMEV